MDITFYLLFELVRRMCVRMPLDPMLTLSSVRPRVLQAQHVFSPVMQGSARMMAPPTHGQPTLVSSSAAQYPEQTHTMYGTSAHR